MKRFLIVLITAVSISSYGQDKYNYVHYNKLTELKGTDFVIATIENLGKLEVKSQYLLFINTKNGESKQIDFPKDAYLEKIEQLKIDSLNINKVMVTGRTVNLDGSKSIDWSDPRQIFILSTDGKEKTQVTDDKYFVSTWAINYQTGGIVITGYYDTNNNGKYDKTDKNEILLYDLRAMKLLAKL